MKIFNGTPHKITIYKREDTFSDGRKLFLKEGADPVAEIPAGTPLNARLETEVVGDVEGIPIFSQKVEAVDQLPDGYDFYVVSALYARARDLMGEDRGDGGNPVVTLPNYSYSLRTRLNIATQTTTFFLRTGVWSSASVSSPTGLWDQILRPGGGSLFRIPRWQAWSGDFSNARVVGILHKRRQFRDF